MLALVAVMAPTAHDTTALADPNSVSTKSSSTKSPSKKPSHRSLRMGLFDLAQIDSANIVMLGDSLTERGPWSEITGCAAIANRGIGGDQSSGVLRRLDGVTKLRPSAVFLMIGINDILSDVPVSAIAANVKQTVDGLVEADARVYLTLALPVTRDARKSANSKVHELNAAYRRLADQPNVTLVDFLDKVQTPDGALRAELSIDGVHLSAQGYRIWRDSIAPLIKIHCQGNGLPVTQAR
jgi:lysophospholipase L1-like esterase